MKQIFNFFFILFLLVTIYSCCKPGTGGDATLIIYPQHHGRAIINHVTWPDTVFIKFNAKEFPGLSPANYDTYFIGKTGEDHVTCTGLKCGQYFLYGVGYDTTGGPYRVTGGMQYKLKHKDRKDETDVDLAITE